MSEWKSGNLLQELLSYPDIWEQILTLLSFDEVLGLRSVNKEFAQACRYAPQLSWLLPRIEVGSPIQSGVCPYACSSLLPQFVQLHRLEIDPKPDEFEPFSSQ